MKLGLNNTKTLLRHCGNPEKRFRSFHVAGTNGKGSTCCFIASILQESGYRTGLYTSPHLIRFSERIRINGAEIPAHKIVAYVRELRDAIEETRATFFEATTALAFRYFADQEVDIAVIETGLGGRLDSTNVLRPVVSVISTIGFDHMYVLGRTLPAIAREKGGIMKRGVDCVVGEERPETLRTLAAVARRRGARLRRADRVLSVTHRSGNACVFRGSKFQTGPIVVPLQGAHQERNARLATAACIVAAHNGQIRISRDAIERGIEGVVRNTGIRARLESCGRRPRFLFDVAHNPEGARALALTLAQTERRPVVVVLGIMADKDVRGIVASLGPVASCFVTATAHGERAMEESDLRAIVRDLGFPVRSGGSVRNALRVARQQAGSRFAILVTGSHYVVGPALDEITGGSA